MAIRWMVSYTVTIVAISTAASSCRVKGFSVAAATSTAIVTTVVGGFGMVIVVMMGTAALITGVDDALDNLLTVGIAAHPNHVVIILATSRSAIAGTHGVRCGYCLAATASHLKFVFLHLDCCSYCTC
jgi:hypothetical protein